MKFLFALAQLGAAVVYVSKLQFANCAALAAILYATLTANVCS